MSCIVQSMQQRQESMHKVIHVTDMAHQSEQSLQRCKPRLQMTNRSYQRDWRTEERLTVYI
jgi:hypothetical protein